MISTVPEMSAESGIDSKTIHSYLVKWRLRGWSNRTGNFLHSTGGGRGRNAKLHFVRDVVWNRFISRYRKRKTKSRQRVRFVAQRWFSMGTESQWRQRYRGLNLWCLESGYRMRNPFVVLPYINEQGEQQ